MAITDTVRDIAGKGRAASAQAASKVSRQSKRARHEVEVRRLERKIRRQKSIIGAAVYERLATGELMVDLPEVNDAVVAIKEFEADLNRARGEIEQLARRDDSEETDETPTSNDGATGGAGDPV